MIEIEFSRGTGDKKYKAKIYENGEKIETVQFGDKNYEQYKDQIGLYSHLDHNDKKRRRAYRNRHSKILNKYGKPAYRDKYSPAWFSYYYLW